MITTTTRRLSATALAVLALAALGAGSAQAAAPGWRVLAASAPTHLPPVTEEVQDVAVDASAGTFTLSFEGQSTAALPFDAEPSAIRAALDALPAISAPGGQVTVAGGPGNPGADNPYSVRFGGALAGHDVAGLAADGSGLKGGATSVAVTTSVAGEESFEGGSLVVSATNVGSAASSTSPPLTASIGPLPGGISTRPLSAGGWTCPATVEGALLTCTYLPSVAGAENVAKLGGDSARTLKVPLTVDGSRAAASSTLPVTVSGGGASAPDSYDVSLVVSSTPADPGVAALWAGAFDADGRPELRAGGHPAFAAAAFWLNTILAPNGTTVIPAGSLRSAEAGLPPGFIGDPLATQGRCPQDALDWSANASSPLCTPAASEVGGLIPALTSLEQATFGAGSLPGALFNDVPAPGSAAEFSANLATLGHVGLLGSVRSTEDFGVDVGALNAPASQKVYGSLTGLWGFPASAAGKAFLRNPTDCSLQREEVATALGPVATLSMNSWQNPDPDAFEGTLSDAQPVVAGCDAVTQGWIGAGPEPEQERPTFSFRPESPQASTGTAATARLHIPQRGLTDPDRLGTSDLKKTVVTLPPGLTLNPSAANGLAACTEAQVGYRKPGEPGGEPLLVNATRFDEKPLTCPEASRIGTVDISSPLLEEELHGTIYLAAQEENPFHSLIALYLVVESERFGLTLKLPGEVKPDPATGQLTATFDDNPQLPFEDLTLHFRGGGPRSQLATPELCGSYKTTGALTPWSAESESPAEAAQIEEEGFQITSGPGGGGCATNPDALPFAPSFEAGTVSTQAGAYAPLVIKVSRRDGEQELTHLDFSLPPGLTGRLAGIPYCPDAAIAEAAGKTGNAEQRSASCPAASEVGTADTSAGVGSEPIHVGGHVYLAGPYEGAPLSSVVITPAVAGPFDLGTVVIRAPLFVNPETAQITAKSDEIPHILKGIPLKLRSVEIKVDRPGFILNPTSCDPMTVGATMSGLNGGSASPSSRFQVGNCAALAFKPKLKIQLKGATGRIGHPALKAVVTYPQGGGYANISRAQVNLPHGEFLDQGNLNKTCTKPVLLAGNCPTSSIYGKARAWTPLLEKPLEGNVYLVGGYGYKLPALVADLNGQIRVTLVGKVDSGPNKGIRSTFEAVPDAPVSRFVLEMKGGKKYGLLENSENLCKAPKADRRAIARFTAQNGTAGQFQPVVVNECGKKKNGKVRRRS